MMKSGVGHTNKRRPILVGYISKRRHVLIVVFKEKLKEEDCMSFDLKVVLP